MKVYLTGYLGFGDVAKNPTETLVEEILKEKDKFNNDKTEIITHQILEVTTDYVDQNITQLYEKIDKDKKDDELNLIVHFGLYASCKVPQIETKAVNHIHDEYKNRLICNKDGKCFLGKLDTENIVNNINCDPSQKICKLSNDCGTYLCNYIFYTSLKRYENVPNVIATFIHIPLFEVFPMSNDIVIFKRFLEMVAKKYIC